MPGPWRIFSQVLGDRRVYIIGRLRDPAQPLHGGNVEYSGEYTEDRTAAEQRLAEQIGRASCRERV